MPIKAIILAAGSGSRMGAATANLPKGMLSIRGKPLLEWQLEVLQRAGINEIAIVTGYRKEAIQFTGVTYYHNADYARTNMVESLMCARAAFNADVLVAYADILYTVELVERMLKPSPDLGVAVDADWRNYWMERYGTTETDLESLTVSDQGVITDIGRSLDSSEGLQYRYIGLIRFSSRALERAMRLRDRKQSLNEPWKQSGKPFPQGYMTDLLHEMREDGCPVKAVVTQGQWLEIDVPKDYEVAQRIWEMRLPGLGSD